MKKVKTYLFLAGLGLISSNTNAQYVYIIHPDDTVTKPTHIIDLVYEMGEADWVVAPTVDRQEATMFSTLSLRFQARGIK